MTVRELIEDLQDLKKDMKVRFNTGYTSTENVIGVEIVEPFGVYTRNFVELIGEKIKL